MVFGHPEREVGPLQDFRIDGMLDELIGDWGSGLVPIALSRFGRLFVSLRRVLDGDRRHHEARGVGQGKPVSIYDLGEQEGCGFKVVTTIAMMMS